MTEPNTALLPPPSASRQRSHPFVRTVATAAALVAGLALAVTAAVVALIGVLAAVAVLLLRRRRPADGPVTLEGRRTPEGWVAEAASR